MFLEGHTFFDQNQGLFNFSFFFRTKNIVLTIFFLNLYPQFWSSFCKNKNFRPSPAEEILDSPLYFGFSIYTFEVGVHELPISSNDLFMPIEVPVLGYCLESILYVAAPIVNKQLILFIQVCYQIKDYRFVA